MKRFPEQRVGQSRSALATSVVLSCVVHVLLVAGVLFLNTGYTPKKHLPITYQVKLVGPPVTVAQTRQGGPAPSAVPKQEKTRKAEQSHTVKPPPPVKTPPKPAVPEPKTVKTVPKALKAPVKPAKTETASVKTAPKKSAPAEPPREHPKPAAEQEKYARTEPHTTPSRPVEQSPPAGGTGGGASDVQTENVVVASTNQGFDSKFGWYTSLLLERIEQSWRPLQDVRNAKVRVVFTINRRGKILVVSIDEKETTGSFRFRQQAERCISQLVGPPLPQEFSKESMEFSVDLMAKN